MSIYSVIGQSHFFFLKYIIIPMVTPPISAKTAG